MTPDYITRTPPTNMDELAPAMLQCEQTPGQSVYQHGQSVRQHLFDLLDALRNGYDMPATWKLPDWLHEYKADILANLWEDHRLHLYTLYHDCGKPYCRHVDKKTGQYHFPDHARASRYVWACVGGNDVVGMLIGEDMFFHTATAEEVKERLANHWDIQTAMSLLLTALAEIHSNAKMFGGIDSTSFKIKWKQIDRRGKQVLKHYFGEKKVAV